jgi:hypothetical protein
MSEDGEAVFPALEDEDLSGFLTDASAAISTEDEIYGHIADLLERPFDEGCQENLASFLRSPELRQANAAARRIGMPKEQ